MTSINRELKKALREGIVCKACRLPIHYGEYYVLKTISNGRFGKEYERFHDDRRCDPR